MCGDGEGQSTHPGSPPHHIDIHSRAKFQAQFQFQPALAAAFSSSIYLTHSCESSSSRQEPPTESASTHPHHQQPPSTSSRSESDFRSHLISNRHGNRSAARRTTTRERRRAQRPIRTSRARQEALPARQPSSSTTAGQWSRSSSKGAAKEGRVDSGRESQQRRHVRVCHHGLADCQSSRRDG